MQARGNIAYCNIQSCRYGHSCKEYNQIEVDGWQGFLDYLAYGDLVSWCKVCDKKTWVDNER